MQTSRSPRLRPLLVLGATLSFALVAGGGDAGATTAPSTGVLASAGTATSAGSGRRADDRVLAVATDYAFRMPKTIKGGWVRLTLDNQGGEEHQITMARLADGQDAGAVEAQLDQDDLSFLAQATLVGGPNGVASGQKASVITDLEPGRYVAFCAVPSPADGIAHFEKGMRTSFTVEQGKGRGSVPKTAGTVTITPSGYTVPKGFTGRGTYAIENAGTFGSELAIMRLAPKATQDDLVAFLTGAPTGPPPFTTAGGVSAMAPGSTAYVHLDLDPGSYVFLSFIPDPAAGLAPQFTQGVISTVTIR